MQALQQAVAAVGCAMISGSSGRDAWNRQMRFLTALALAALLAPSETAAMAMPHFGLECGSTFSSYDYSDESPYRSDGRWSPRLGLVAGFDLGRSFRLMSVVGYGGRGSRSEWDQGLFVERQRIQERTLGLSLLVSRSILHRGAIEIGPRWDYRLDGTATGTVQSGLQAPTYYTFDYTREGNRWDTGVVVGAELRLFAASLYGRYVHGLISQQQAGHFIDLRSLPWTSTRTFTLRESVSRSVEFGIRLGQ